MEKKKKVKLKNIYFPESQIETIGLHEMYKWEEMFLSKKGKKESLKGFG